MISSLDLQANSSPAKGTKIKNLLLAGIGYRRKSGAFKLSLESVVYCVSVRLQTGGLVDGATVTYVVNGITYNALLKGYTYYIHSIDIDSLTVVYNDFNETFISPSILSSECYEVVIPEDPCFNTEPYNYFNLFRFHGISSPLPIGSLESCTESSPIPLSYEKFCERESATYAKHNEEYSFYHNLTIPQNNSDFASLKMAFVKDSDLSIAHEFGSILNYDGDNLYASFIVPDTVATGVYRLLIYTVSDSARYLSNKIEVLDSGIADRKTVLIESRNFKNRLGFNFEGVNISTKIRIFATQKYLQSKYETKQTVYREISTGKSRAVTTESDKITTFLVQAFDEYMSDALQKTIENSEVYINGQRYVKASNLALVQSIDRYKSNGEFEMIQDRFSTLNNNNC